MVRFRALLASITLGYPLKRKGDKGSGQWQRLTWNQALNEITDNLGDLSEQYGAETLALAVRLGQNEHWPWETVDDVWDYRLAPVGLTFNQLLE
jgi:hypothetical protein